MPGKQYKEVTKESLEEFKKKYLYVKLEGPGYDGRVFNTKALGNAFVKYIRNLDLKKDNKGLN